MRSESSVSEFVLRIQPDGDVLFKIQDNDGEYWELILDPNDAIGLSKVLGNVGKQALEKKEAMLIA